MPDSLLPIQGPASYGERDLDRLLSCDAGYPAVVLGPVADVMAALRAAPRPDELGGEAAARAAFRLFVLPDAGQAGAASGPDPLRRRAAAGQHRLDRQGPPAGLPRAASAGPRHGRPRRRLPWRASWQVMTVAGSAAAAVIVGSVALAGVFSGPGGHQGTAGQRPSATVTATASSDRATSSVLGRGAGTVPTAPSTPRPAAGSAGPDELCHQYVEYLLHPGPPKSWALSSVYQQLSRLAGGGSPVRIDLYCARWLWPAEPGANPGSHDGGGDPGSGNQQGGSRPDGPAVLRLSRPATRSLSGGR
jgi:hypothetical protein